MKLSCKLLLLAFFVSGIKQGYAQISPFSSMYFQNKYQINPASVGEANTINLNTTVKASFLGIEGAPKMQTITADWGVSDRVGVGFNVVNEKAGLISRTSASASYAFRTPLHGDDLLSFGVSGGLYNESLNTSKFIGDHDVAVGEFNDRPMYFDTGFGASYQSNDLNLETSFPNLFQLFKESERNTLNSPLFYTSVSYRFHDNYHGYYIEPLLAVRGFQYYDNILDVGAKANFSNDKVILNAFYHTSKNVTLGFGSYFTKSLSFMMFYSANTSNYQTYSKGQFELNIKYAIKRDCKGCE